MSKDTYLEVLPGERAFSVINIERILTPALLIDRARVQHNILAMMRLLAGNANRWRPHVKTAKLGYVMRMFAGSGIRQFKCATTLELKVACESGAEDVLVAYPVTGANATRVLDIARENPKVRISALVENRDQVAQWHATRIGLFVDVNPGMNRTGVTDEDVDAILRLTREIGSAGLEFRGFHYYDGHLHDENMSDRAAEAHKGYRRLMHLVRELASAGVTVEEVITSGTPAFPCSLSFNEFATASFVHRVSPGTVIYGDATSLSQLPQEYGFLPAALVLSRVVSHPAPDIITCDAGHKTVSADAGVPTCIVVGRPELTPLRPSEEHLPMGVALGGKAPAVGEVLYLLPRHICPTVNNFEYAVIVEDSKPISVEPVSARGRERPLAL